jgi:cold shock CspA family protein
MAKSKETYNKKEKEKKRLKQQQEKKQKMEERKANNQKGLPLENMLAYIDENGNLSDSPPDPRKMKVFKQEEIEIQVPKYEKLPDELKKGIIDYYNTDKGFGFIRDLTSGEKIFFHINNVTEAISEKDKVSFNVENGPRGLNAIDVSPVKE